MPRGGHPRSGPRAKSKKEREESGARTRRHHAKVDRVLGGKDVVDAPSPSVEPPPMLTETQQEFWRYYAPLLAKERRLTLKVRDALARYCITQAMVKRLNEDIESLDTILVLEESGERVHPMVTTLRQFLQISRQYDTDLLLNPAADLRAPVGEDPDKPEPADPMAKFARGMKVLKGGRGA